MPSAQSSSRTTTLLVITAHLITNTFHILICSELYNKSSFPSHVLDDLAAYRVYLQFSCVYSIIALITTVHSRGRFLRVYAIFLLLDAIFSPFPRFCILTAVTRYAPDPAKSFTSQASTLGSRMGDGGSFSLFFNGTDPINGLKLEAGLGRVAHALARHGSVDMLWMIWLAFGTFFVASMVMQIMGSHEVWTFAKEAGLDCDVALLDHGNDGAADIQWSTTDSVRGRFDEEEGMGSSHEGQRSPPEETRRRIPTVWKWLSFGRGADVYW